MSTGQQFETFDPQERLGIVSHVDLNTNTEFTIAHQKERSPEDYHEDRKTYSSEGSVALNVYNKFRLIKDHFIPSKHSYVKFNFAAAITGPTTPAILPTYDTLAESASVRLKYGTQIIEEMTGKQIWFEHAFYQAQGERMGSQKLMNDTTAANRQTNNTNNIDYYINLGNLLSRHIHLPLNSYENEWFVEVKFDPLNRMVTGGDTTAGSGSLSTVQLIIHGHKVSSETSTDGHEILCMGLTHHYHDVTQETAIVAASTTSKTFTFNTLRGMVSTIVMFAVEDAKYLSTDPSVLKRDAFSDLGDGTFSFGTTTQPDKYTNQPQRLRLLRYNKHSSESHAVQLDYDGSVRDIPIYILELSPRSQMDFETGSSSGSAKVDGSEQIKITLNGNPSPDTQLRYYFLFYQNKAVSIKCLNASKSESH